MIDNMEEVRSSSSESLFGTPSLGVPTDGPFPHKLDANFLPFRQVTNLAFNLPFTCIRCEIRPVRLLTPLESSPLLVRTGITFYRRKLQKESIVRHAVKLLFI